MKTLTRKQIKDLINLTDKESVKSFINNEDNYNTKYKIFEESEALDYVCNMYEGDLYMLGCFNADFIEDFIALDYQDIKAIQDGEKFEIIGKLVMNSGNFGEMMQEYIRLDGYGHALNSYDGDYNIYENLIIIRQN